MNTLKKLKGSSAGTRQVLPLKVNIVKAVKCKNNLMEAIVVDNSACSKVVIYNKTCQPFVVEGNAVMLLNTLVKASEIIVDQQSRMALLPKALEIPRKIMDQAEMLQLSQQHQSDQKIENLTNIADSTTVTILGQITELKEIQTFPSKYPPFQDVEVRNGSLSDDTGCVEFALWRKLAASKIQVGDTVRLHQMTKSTSTYAGTSRPKITSGRYTSIEHTVAAFNIKEPEDNFAEDGVIEAVLNAALYTACSQCKTSTKEGQFCFRCNTTVTPIKMPRCEVLIKQEDDYTPVTLFKTQLQDIIPTIPEEVSDLTSSIMTHLPTTIRFTRSPKKGNSSSTALSKMKVVSTTTN
ncbi:uncharacterized protein [Amphiura filiformis]|uniref:uncharacterized protein n=1 Tax=Amphiura filiformis TaxID=82378 RepID=UPI003B20CD19